jgi:hypothetical protein
MNKFYKYFTISVLSLSLLSGLFYLTGKQFLTTVLAQDSENKHQDCDKYKVIILEDSQQKTVHVAYDFATQTVSVVQIQKVFSPPAIIINSKNLTGK